MVKNSKYEYEQIQRYIDLLNRMGAKIKPECKKKYGEKQLIYTLKVNLF